MSWKVRKVTLIDGKSEAENFEPFTADELNDYITNLVESAKCDGLNIHVDRYGVRIKRENALEVWSVYHRESHHQANVLLFLNY